MISRIELKYILNKKKDNFFLDWLFQNNFKELYPTRKINSIYYDNLRFQSYFDSVEGVIPRKKIRIRWYGDKLSKSLNLENKITYFSNRKKYSKKVSEIYQIIHDADYGNCKPLVKVSYNRSYFWNNGIRITIDKNINFFNYSSTKKKSEKSISLIEIKCEETRNNLKFINEFPFRNIRYSKYGNCIESIFYNFFNNKVDY